MDPVLEPEMFDPETETFEVLCPKSLARLYHTTAVLLPDARVLVAGHDGALNMPPHDSSRCELEIYTRGCGTTRMYDFTVGRTQCP